MSPRAKTVTATRRAPRVEQRAAQPLATTNGAPARGDRIGVRKTYKLYIGGAFPRTESGRAYEIFGAKGELLANACRGRGLRARTHRPRPPERSR